MTIQRVLVAVDDSPAALRAAHTAANLAAGWHARLHLVTVTADHTLSALLDAAGPDGGATGRVEQAGRALRTWNVNLIVMGRSDRRGPSSAYLGSVTAHVLEFADCPVLVVPQSRSTDPDNPQPHAEES